MPKQDGYFLLRYYTLTDIFPLGNMALCVARTFLSDIPIVIGTERWNSLLHCKNKTNFSIFATTCVITGFQTATIKYINDD
jgi:hypothetical protein